MRILITGSRDWDDLEIIETELRCAVATAAPFARITVVHGAAAGADCYAAGMAHVLGMQVESHPAEWARLGKSAGMRRNIVMVESGIDVCLAFIKNNSRGASQRAALAEAHGIPVNRYTA